MPHQELHIYTESSVVDGPDVVLRLHTVVIIRSENMLSWGTKRHAYFQTSCFSSLVYINAPDVFFFFLYKCLCLWWLLHYLQICELNCKSRDPPSPSVIRAYADLLLKSMQAFKKKKLHILKLKIKKKKVNSFEWSLCISLHCSLMTVHFSCLIMGAIWTWSRRWQSKKTNWRDFKRKEGKIISFVCVCFHSPCGVFMWFSCVSNFTALHNLFKLVLLSFS